MDELVNFIKDYFVSNNFKLSVAESITGGNLQATLTSISGASDFFEGGVTAYSINQKVNLLGVDFDVAKENNCVSKEVADQMALGVSKLFDTEFGISTTGYAQGDLYAYYSICKKGETISSGRIDGNNIDRISMQELVTKEVLKKLKELLI